MLFWTKVVLFEILIWIIFSFLVDLKFVPDQPYYYPLVYFNSYWNLDRDYIPINSTIQWEFAVSLSLGSEYNANNVLTFECFFICCDRLYNVLMRCEILEFESLNLQLVISHENLYLQSTPLFVISLYKILLFSSREALHSVFNCWCHFWILMVLHSLINILDSFFVILTVLDCVQILDFICLCKS